MQSLRKYLPFLTIVLCLGYIFVSQKNPCNSPITYKIGNFDTRFGISQKDFLQVLNQASDIWSTSAGKKVLIYDPKGELTVNLTYDQRQKVTQTNQTLQADAAKIHELANTVKAQYQNLENNHQLREKEYETMVALFAQHQNEYGTQVSYWNAQGGAPVDVYTQLLTEKNNLTTERVVLENKRLEVNALVEQINTFINKYNLLVNSANANIDTINQSAGKEFEEGVYDSSKNEITIYEFSTNKKLIRVVTHELGHALLLPHNSNPKSIMYELNQANTITLSKEDTAALQLRCTTMYPFINYYTNLKALLLSFLP